MPKVFGRGRSAQQDKGASGDAKRVAPDAPADARLPKGNRGRAATPVAPAGEPPVDYAQIGEHVAAVLEAAKEAAEKMRLDAYTEAQKLRAAMKEQGHAALETAKATADRAEAHAASVSADAERQSREVREQADEYAKDRRKVADSEAAAVLARAEKQASVAERTFQERQLSLDESVIRTENRLRELVAGLHELASGLEQLAGPGDHGANGDRDNGSLVDDLTRSASGSHSPRESETT
jgi:hypothetical protein